MGQINSLAPNIFYNDGRINISDWVFWISLLCKESCGDDHLGSLIISLFSKKSIFLKFHNFQIGRVLKEFGYLANPIWINV